MQFCSLVMETAAAILAHVAQRIEHSYVPGNGTGSSPGVGWWEEQARMVQYGV